MSDVVQVRLTSHAVTFLEGMLAPMLGSAIGSISESIVTAGSVNFTLPEPLEFRRKKICSDERVASCGASVQLRNTKLTMLPNADPNQPDRLKLSLEVLAHLTHIDKNGNSGRGWPSTEHRTTRIFCSIRACDRNCNLDFNTAENGQDHIGIELTFELGVSGVAPREDANVITMLPMTGSTGHLTGISMDDVTLGCGLDSAMDLVPGNIPNFIVHTITQEVSNRIPKLIGTFLCENPTSLLDENGNQLLILDGEPAACPQEALPSNGQMHTYSFGMDGLLTPVRRCGASSAACLPMLLGVEGRLDMSSLLSALAPGFAAILDFVVAAADGATTRNNGLSVWLKGGIDAATGASNCVPRLSAEEHPFPAYLETPDKPFVLPRSAVFEGNTHPITGQNTDVMVGVSEDFINWAAFMAWESGALCLQIGSSTLPMLDPALVGILFGADLANLVFPASDSDSPLGVGLRPQKPPTIRFDNAEEGGVIVGVSMPEVQLDFYAWTLDRYVRFVTFELDLKIAVAVTVNNGAIALDLLGLEIPRAVAMNDSLLRSGSGAAGLISNVVGGLIPSFLGDDGPLFELDIAGILREELEKKNIPLPLSIELKDDALAAVYTNASGATIPARSDDGHAFLGVFVDFVRASGRPAGLTAAIDTQVEITSVHIPEDKSAFAAETFGEGELPRVEFVMSASAPAGVPVEYRYRLGLGGWSDWQDSPYGVIESPLLLLQQDHTVFARARVKGEPRTEDRSSAQARFSTDVTPPLVDITAESKGLRVQAFDFHTRASKLEYRYREPEGEFSEWAAFGAEATALIDGSRDVEIEVRDEAGNIASNVAELRGLPPPSAAAGGCSCSAAGPMAGSSSTSMLGFFAMVGMIGGMMYRLRRREEKV